MPPSVVVADASPLIVLFKAELDHLLVGLWSTVLLPEPVWEEIQIRPHDAATIAIPSRGWIQRVPVPDSDPRLAEMKLGDGEIAAISVALALPEAAVLIDDSAGRRAAAGFGLMTFSTATVLLTAKKHGLLSNVRQPLAAVRAQGLWMSNAVAQTVMLAAGE